MNKKGFTLTELLVVVVILGIISGLSIPLIRNLTAGFEKRKYESYADSMLSAGKLFNDSYGEDLFGHNEYGCAYILYDKLVERRLLNDIEIDGMSCNSNKTYIRVIKQKDKYAYKTYLTCGPKTTGKIETESFSIPNVVPEIDNNSCTGVNNGNLSITADMSQATGTADKNRKKTKLTISSGTGISNVISVSAKWSQTNNDHAPEGFAKVDFKVKENQEESLLNGDIISTTSKELLTPSGNGDYYLIVRVDHLQDLQGNNWKNPDNTDSKFVYFGPFVVDNTAPTINVVTYKCNESLNKTGTQTGSKQIASGSTGTVFNLSNMQGTVNGWATSEMYPNGVCIDFEISDNLSIKSSKWEWNQTGLKANATGYKTFDDNHVSTSTYESGIKNKTVLKSLSADGHRYARFTVKDYAGNKTSVDIDLKLDKTGPTTPTIVNSSNGRWVNTNVTLTLSSSDALNNIEEYYYTYNEFATAIGTDSSSEWVKLNGGTGKTSFTTEPWTDNMNKKVYIKVRDTLGNSSATGNTNIKIDKTKPTTPTIVNSSGGVWTKNDVTLTLGSTDTYSGIDEYYYTYNANASTIGTNSSSEWVKLNGGTGKTSFTTEPWSVASGSELNKTTYIRVYDVAGNYSDSNNTNIKVDKKAPTSPTITNPNFDQDKGETVWTNAAFTLTLQSSDSGSGLKDYQYTFNSSASEVGTNQETQWISYGNNATETYTTGNFETEREENVYIRACDQVGNCSSKNQSLIRIDKTSPECGSFTKSGVNSQSGVSGTVPCTDTKGNAQSGCQKETYSISTTKSTKSVTIKDNAGNTKSCEMTVTSYSCDKYKCGTEKYDCKDVCTSTYLYQGGAQSASSCTTACGKHGGSLKSTGSHLTKHNMGGGGYYYTCESSSVSGDTGLGCCYCNTSCSEQCKTRDKYCWNTCYK